MQKNDNVNVDKNILGMYIHAKARLTLLNNSIIRIRSKVDDMEKTGYLVTDSVTCGKKGKRPLARKIISGFPLDTYKQLRSLLNERENQLRDEQINLENMTSKVEEYISCIQDIEMRNILTLYYIENHTWLKVSHRMNEIYKKKYYTEDSCRLKLEYFLKK